MLKKVVIIGPAWPLRGGLASFDQRLAKQFTDEGADCMIYSFSLQYPSFLFPGTTQFSSDPPPAGIKIETVINSVNPLNWIQVGRRLRKLRPDIIVVRFWLPFMGPSLGTILRLVKRNGHTKIIAITDNVIPHEKRFGDRQFTRYFLGACDGYITMSDKVRMDLETFNTGKPVRQVVHPLYDNFGEPVNKELARNRLQIPTESKLVLFFGFIRKYKGLDILLKAMSEVKKTDPNIRLLIAGEYYEDDKPYLQQIAGLNIADVVIAHTHFIPDEEVKYYLCAADVVVQPYRNATQSGVTPLSYHFEKPMIVSNVGSLPALVPHNKVGLVTEPNPSAIASAILRFFELGEKYFITHLRSEKEKYSWTGMTSAILKLADDIQK
jgi:glycosyltransferase involved in cell wall biosynthesis